MRFLIVAGVAALLLTPAVASACGASKAQAVSSEYSAAKKKKPVKVAKKVRKPKDEYMRAAPM